VSVDIKVFAYSVPAICIVLGFLLIVLGSLRGDSSLSSSGWTFVFLGVVLQVLWLFRRRIE
jgi:hypothetical protein